MPCRFQAGYGTALVSAALNDAGIVLAAEDVLRDALSTGRLVRVLPGYKAPSRTMWVFRSIVTAHSGPS
jgi:DNA-binding transcriptional LysR family regulator